MRFRELFYLQRSDRQIILALLCVIVLALVVFIWAGGDAETPAPVGTDTLPTAFRQARQAPVTYRVESRSVELFDFDPNTADSTQLLRLGLLPWQVRNIYAYRASGGYYTKPEDFARLYGLTQKQYRQLKPHIRIAADYRQARDNQLYAYTLKTERDTIEYPYKLEPGESVDLSLADTLRLRHVPGIGRHFARKIIDYRQRLGGFYSIYQLRDIEDFPETAISFFRLPDGATVRKINLNRLSLNELKRHPYINFRQARAIVEYRRMHGPLKSLQELHLSPDFPAEAIARLEPYAEY